MKFFSKYKNKPQVVDGHRFPSIREAKRYGELKLLLQSGEIRGLVLQPRYPLRIQKKLICTYVADFRYTDKATGKVVVEDCKGFKTSVYKLKKKLIEAIEGMTILET